MKKLIFTLLAACGLSASAGNLWIVGNATPQNWDLDKATTLLSTPEAPNVYTGTLYLMAGQDADNNNRTFKFMSVPDYDDKTSPQYAAVKGTSLVDGSVDLAEATSDNDFSQLYVNEDANYVITVNLDTKKITVVKSPYQDTHIDVCSLYIVGDVTPAKEDEWVPMKGIPMYQNQEAPYEYATGKVALKGGTFKIACALKGASSWNNECYYFCDKTDGDKMALNLSGDPQWSIPEAANYSLKADLNTHVLAIDKVTTTGIESVEADASDAPAEYYTLTGIRISAPAAGQVCIVKRGTKVSKVLVK